MLTYEKFSGINNVQPEHRLTSTDLLSATNMDIGLSGEITRREGYSLLSDQCHKNLWQADGFMLATKGAQLTALHPGGAQHVVHPAMGPARVWYCNLPDGRVTFSNGLIYGLTDGVTGRDLFVPTPEAVGFYEDAVGALHRGGYRYFLSYVRLSDNLEGPATAGTSITVGEGGVRLAGLPTRAGHAVNVYLSAKDGEEAYLAGTTSTGAFEFTGANESLVLLSRTLGAMSPVGGTITAYWRGRLLMAQGDVLWASRPMAPHLADWRDFKRMPAPITAIQPVGDGLYVGTEEDLVFLAGDTWDTLAYRATELGPVVLGSGVSAPGHRLRQGDAYGVGPAMVCIAGGKIVAGFSGGATFNLTEDRYRTGVKEVCATFREVRGIPQYIAVPQ